MNYIWFVGRASGVLVGALVAIPLIRLGVLLCPCCNLVLIDADFAIFNPRIELRQGLGVVVLADARIHPVIPAVHAADDVVAIDVTVSHQSATMRAAAVKNTDLIVEADRHKIDARNQRMHQLAIAQFIPIQDWFLFHRDCPVRWLFRWLTVSRVVKKNCH